MYGCPKKECFWFNRQFFNDHVAFEFKKMYGDNGYPKSCDRCKYSLRQRINRLENKIIEAKATSENNFLKDKHSLDFIIKVDDVKYSPLEFSDKCINCNAHNCDAYEITAKNQKDIGCAIIGKVCFSCLEKRKNDIRKFIKELSKKQFEVWRQYGQ